jgi:hypothetical protein
MNQANGSSVPRARCMLETPTLADTQVHNVEVMDSRAMDEVNSALCCYLDHKRVAGRQPSLCAGKNLRDFCLRKQVEDRGYCGNVNIHIRHLLLHNLQH